MLLANSDEEIIEPNLAQYDRFSVMFSGGKDSVACVLMLLDRGVPPEKIELLHHLVDGKEGSTLFDWPCSESYCQAFANAFGLRCYMSWRKGGLEREMLRNNQRTAPVLYESEDGTIEERGGTRGIEGTRERFPQVSSDLSVRWCSPSAKVDVGARVLNHEPRFRHGKTLVVTGERAAESASRATYPAFEKHRCDLRNGRSVRRHIDHWRPVHGWTEEDVWRILERYRIRAHPAYWLGFSRASCRTCVFLNADGWATVRKYMPGAFIPIVRYEARFGLTIHRTRSVDEQADLGTPYTCDPRHVAIAESADYREPIIMDKWELPPGAYRAGCGPT